MVQNPNRCPTHPGELLLKDIVPATGKTEAELADMLGISSEHFLDVLTETKPVNAEVAVRLGKLFGNSPSLWARMQTAHDTWVAERNVDVSDIPTLKKT